MHIFLDDLRDTPPGWTRTYTVEETINWLNHAREKVGSRPECVSLDNDLGYRLTEGYKVARWIEEQAHEVIYNPPYFMLGIPRKVIIHTANSRAANEMAKAIESANRALQAAKQPLIIVERPFGVSPGNALYQSGMGHPWSLGEGWEY